MMSYIFGIATLAVALLAGEYIKILTATSVPAPVIGILILVLWLAVLGRIPDGLHTVATFLLRHMALFFIPALILVLEQVDILANHGIVLMVIIVIGTALALPLTALLFVWLADRRAL